MIKEIVSPCLQCQFNKQNNHKYGKISGFANSKAPFDFIASDIVGPFNLEDFSEPERKFWLITFIDIYTRTSNVQIIYDLKSKSLISTLMKWIQLYGKPKKILTDQGKAYISKLFSNYCKKENIINSYATIYNPTCNGIAERINKTIKELLRIYKNIDINKLIKIINLRLNIFNHRIMKASPFEVTNNYNWFDINKTTTNKQQLAITNVYVESKNNETATNQKRLKSHKYKINDKVLVKNPLTHAIDSLYYGPYKITEIDEHSNKVKIDKGDKEAWENIKRIKTFVERRCGKPHKQLLLISTFDIYRASVSRTTSNYSHGQSLFIPPSECSISETKGDSTFLLTDQSDCLICQKVFKQS